MKGVGSVRIFRLLAVTLIWVLITATSAPAQFPVISAEDLMSWMNRKAVLIDSRMPEEYQAGHIPGAINIPAERMKPEGSRLPKDKSRPIIFYCRGAG